MLTANQEYMKVVNVYYRKRKTLEGCPGLSLAAAGELHRSMAADWRKDPVPFPSYLLSNNNASIHRIEQHISCLKNRAEFVGWEFPGSRAEVNEGEKRLQLFF